MSNSTLNKCVLFMCLNPLRIQNRTKSYQFKDMEDTFIRKLPSLTGNDFAINHLVRPYHFTDLIVPCGKCLECLSAKQNDLSVRVAAEANKRGSMHFITLTYDWRYVPLAYSLRMVDKTTGEVFNDNVCRVVPREYLKVFHRNKKVKGSVVSESYPKYPEFFSYFRMIRDSLCSKPKCKEGRVLSVPYNESMQDKLFGRDFRLKFNSDSVDYLDDDLVEHIPDMPFFDDDYYYYLDFSLSLCRRDVRMWLKRSRVAYEREFGEKLPDFSYVVVGEYGCRTARPHYHIAFFGLNDRQAYYLASKWKFGHFDFRSVDRLHRNKSGKVDGSGFVAAGKYLGKYMSKGFFDCPLVKSNSVEKPRLMLSIDFGIEGDKRIEVVKTPKGSYERVRFDVPTSVIKFYRCEDVLGVYNPSTCIQDSDLSFSYFDLEKLHNLVKERKYYSVDGKKFHIPKILLRRIWYEKEGLIRKVEKPTIVRRALQAFIQSDFLDDFIRKFRENCPEASNEELVMQGIAFLSNQKLSNENKAKSYEKSLREFYSKSIY